MAYKLLSTILASLSFSSVFAQFSTPTVGVPHSAQNQKFIEVYGHRGDRSYSPENTIPSYRTALKVGVNWVDIDILGTKDHKILADHDLHLNPDLVQENGHFITEQKPVIDLTYQQLQKYDVGKIKPESSYAKYFPNQVPVKNTHMPLLEDVIAYVNKNSNNNVNFQLEIKSTPENDSLAMPPKEFAEELYTLLKKYKILDRVEIQAFDWRYLYAIQDFAKQNNKQIRTAYLVDYPDFEQRMKSDDPKIAGLWTGGKLVKDYNGSVMQMIKTLGGCCYEPEDQTLTKEQLEEAHKLGLKVVVWGWPEQLGTAFDPKLMAKLIDWGVDGIITDNPGRLNSMLAARGYPVPKNYPAE